MTKKRNCDICGKDFTEGTGAEFKLKHMANSLWKIADACATCTKEKVLPNIQNVKWSKYDNESKKFLEYQGVVEEI